MASPTSRITKNNLDNNHRAAQKEAKKPLAKPHVDKPVPTVDCLEIVSPAGGEPVGLTITVVGTSPSTYSGQVEVTVTTPSGLILTQVVTVSGGEWTATFVLASTDVGPGLSISAKATDHDAGICDDTVSDIPVSNELSIDEPIIEPLPLKGKKRLILTGSGRTDETSHVTTILRNVDGSYVGAGTGTGPNKRWKATVEEIEPGKKYIVQAILSRGARPVIVSRAIVVPCECIEQGLDETEE